jgi:hypothetical protein
MRAVRQQKFLSLIYLFCSVFIKYVFWFAFSFVVVYFYRQPAQKKNLYHDSLVILGGLMIVLFLFSPLGFRLDFLNGLQKQLVFLAPSSFLSFTSVFPAVLLFFFDEAFLVGLLFYFSKFSFCVYLGLYYLKQLKQVWQKPPSQ